VGIHPEELAIGSGQPVSRSPIAPGRHVFDDDALGRFGPSLRGEGSDFRAQGAVQLVERHREAPSVNLPHASWGRQATRAEVEWWGNDKPAAAADPDRSRSEGVRAGTDQMATHGHDPLGHFHSHALVQTDRAGRVLGIHVEPDELLAESPELAERVEEERTSESEPSLAAHHSEIADP